MEIYYSPKFLREYKKLSLEVKKKAEEKEVIFRKNPYDPRIKTHALTGRLHGFWVFSIDYSHRIIFEFISKSEVHFHSVGTHDIYK